jgi:hypothetical protein
MLSNFCQPKIAVQQMNRDSIIFQVQLHFIITKKSCTRIKSFESFAPHLTAVFLVLFMEHL